MSQPQAYERVTDFTERDGDDTDHPALNQEFDQAAQSINEIRANLAQIQRDDGALKNGIVTADSLSPDAFDAVLGNVSEAVGQAQDAATSALTSATTANSARDQTVVSAAAAQTSQTAAALNASTASTAASAATSSQAAAATSAAAALTSENSADVSEAAALASQTASATSAAAALASKNAAAASAAATLVSENNADTSEAGALASQNSAATSATTATSQAGIATTKAGEASASAADAASTLANAVQRTSATGSTKATVGTTAQRDGVPEYGWERTNSTLNQKEWWNNTAWVAMGGGATGGPGNHVFYLNDKIITQNFTIPPGQNAGSFGSITIADGIDVEISDDSEWSIV